MYNILLALGGFTLKFAYLFLSIPLERVQSVKKGAILNLPHKLCIQRERAWRVRNLASLVGFKKITTKKNLHFLNKQNKIIFSLFLCSKLSRASVSSSVKYDHMHNKI